MATKAQQAVRMLQPEQFNDILERYNRLKLKLDRVARLEKKRNLRFREAEDELKAYMKEVGLPAGVVGDFQVEYQTDSLPQMEDAEAFYEYLLENEATELLQKRLNQGECVALVKTLPKGESIPGVTWFTRSKLRRTRLA